jgi:uncharacterized membrane protein YfcA
MLLSFVIFLLGVVVFGISAISGGGASLILMPFLGMVISPLQIPFTLTLGAFISSVSRIITFKEHIRWSVVKYYVIPAILSAIFGVWLLTLFKPVYVIFVLGLFLISNLPIMIHRIMKNRQLHIAYVSDAEDEVLNNEKTVENVSNTSIVFIGLASGFLSRFTGAVGLIFNKFYSKIGLSKEEIVATRAMNDISIHSLKLFLYVYMGLFSFQAFNYGIIISISAIISAILMKPILKLIKDNLFSYIGEIVTIMAGFLMLAMSGEQILAF